MIKDLRQRIQQVIVDQCGPGWELYAPNLADAIIDAIQRYLEPTYTYQPTYSYSSTGNSIYSWSDFKDSWSVADHTSPPGW